jgi:uncharacterized protein YbcI
LESSRKLTGGDLNAAVTREVIRVYLDTVGKGPKKAFTLHSGNVLMTILEGTMSRGERKLVSAGNGEAVWGMKRLFHRMMDADLRAAIHRLTGQRVIASMSDSHFDPDLAIVVFTLDGPLVAIRHSGS